MNTLLLSMLGAVAEFERAMIRERQREGVAIAKAAGKYKGRKASLSTAQASALRERLANGESVTALATEYGVSRQTFYNYKIA
jgi:DNA invertase Pin-like site-specific DNA recombinase